MFQTETPRCTDLFSAAGKVFLLGEYAVLADKPAVVAAIEPRFEMTFEDHFSKPPHPQSPVARLMQWAERMGATLASFELVDQHRGMGGFGGSTAEFALVYLALARENNWKRDWKTVWKLYRELMASEPVTPSGADLVAQWQGGVVFFDPSDGHCMDVWPLFDWSNLLVFSAGAIPGRKTATHEHLRHLERSQFPKGQPTVLAGLETILIDGLSAIRENDGEKLGRAFDSYAQTLSAAGYEMDSAREDRLALRKLSGVLGVKGCGAMLSDGVILLLESGSRNKGEVIRAAEERGLKLLNDGLTCQQGVTCQLRS
ncbi:MAG: hypothetical protein AABZ55_01190 [Bdellovibrionota bacterium]